MTRNPSPIRPVLAVTLALVHAVPLSAQYAPHFIEPPAALEARLETGRFEIRAIRDIGYRGSRSKRVTLAFRDGVVLDAKWAVAAPGGRALNNQPQYEIGAYELQKLFLEPEDYVVPPTRLRSLPLRLYQQLDSTAGPTFEGTSSVLVLLQYWLPDVTYTEREVWDPALFQADTVYARHFANADVLTYLIRMADANPGNLLISTDSSVSRVFAVDNGVAWTSPDGRGTHWSELEVDRLPRETVERLRAITREQLDSALAVVAQFAVDDAGRLVRAEITPKRTPHVAVEHADGIVQLGLMDVELENTWERLRALLARVDAGEVGVF